eukprot:TRINITY_DN847_c0_g1_i1.p1 TRINITY_DN847_c0_g1~~TRINITY_DN847_c0_g1_i1.p1  ORF type:complete len:544 (-),score=243.52 TRINITY_DN847_c0_g1_i1:107-1738(-)
MLKHKIKKNEIIIILISILFYLNLINCAPIAPLSIDPYIWPLPQSYSFGSNTIQLTSNFQFISPNHSQILSHAFTRYYFLMFTHGRESQGTLKSVEVIFTSNNETLQLGTNESYSLFIDNEGSKITATTVYGALRGLETFSQLVTYDFNIKSYVIRYAPWQINDAPRFTHRGILLDTSRHFQPLSFLKKVLNSMSYAKLNVLHWHAVDAQSFPVEIKSHSLLWNGAYSEQEKYTQEDIAEIVEYAKLRGIRVMIEFDTPGHAYSWGVGYPELLPDGYEDVFNCPNKCPPEAGNPCNVPLDPSKDFTYEVVSDVLHEVTGGKSRSGLFPEDLIHLGGDEVDSSCWSKSASIKEFMQENGFTDYNQVYEYFINFTLATAIANQRYPVFWEEVFENFGTQLDKKSIVHVWLDKTSLQSAVAAGYRAILSNNDLWYLDHLETEWDDMYQNEPFETITDPTQQSLVLGGETCMWAETVDPSNVLNTIWPRAAAVAERLWSAREVNDLDAAAPRIHSFRCLLTRRGIPSGPVNLKGRAAPLEPGACESQ